MIVGGRRIWSAILDVSFKSMLKLLLYFVYRKYPHHTHIENLSLKLVFFSILHWKRFPQERCRCVPFYLIKLPILLSCSWKLRTLGREKSLGSTYIKMTQSLEKFTNCRCQNKLKNILTYINILIFSLKCKVLHHILSIVLCFVHTLKINLCSSADC